MIAEKLRQEGMSSFFMIGETSLIERQNIVSAFQDNKIDALVIGQAVGSFGHTLTAARSAVYLERNYDGNYFQSLHRFRRIGTKEHPVVLHLRSVDSRGKQTVDHLIHNVLDYRIQMIQKLTVGMIKDYL